MKSDGRSYGVAQLKWKLLLAILINSVSNFKNAVRCKKSYNPKDLLAGYTRKFGIHALVSSILG